ncbi:MAG: GNAT family N-acetyltransferase [Bacteriovorax sp.]|nr:GNAT family N-acetyltransferase [Bacteriovorax sp.]
MKIFEIKKSERHLYQDQIVRLEKMANYPLGSDSFYIDHGKDYFAFFDRLGESHYFVCTINNEVVAVAAGIIRKVPKRVFYLCDLKVHPKYQRKRIPLKILSHAALRYYLKCPRGYAIAMDKEKQKENRTAKLLQHFRWLRITPVEKLSIYSFSYEDILGHRELIEKHKGPIYFLSLIGIKDLILDSTKFPMKLLHLQYGHQKQNIKEESITEAQVGHIHMLALTSNDPLKKELDQLNIHPSSSATVIEHNMKDFDWNFIRTSDI